MNNNEFKYLLQPIYGDGTVTVGPFTGRRFTGFHMVTRYSVVDKKVSKFLLPPCNETMGIGADGQSIGFEVQQIQMALQISGQPATQTEESRVGNGQILYGNPLHLGVAGVRRVMRKANLLESREGYGG